MKKLKRISALLGVFILIAMYLCTLIFALIDSPVASDLLKASIAATIFVPVILYGSPDGPTHRHAVPDGQHR